MTEEKYDYEPVTVAEALAWVQKMYEEVKAFPITEEESKETFDFSVSADIAEVCDDKH